MIRGSNDNARRAGSVGFSVNAALGAPWLIGCRFIT